MFDVPLGDLMRGERATLGKSLLDVERELRIRATYIAAIENGDIGAFQSAGFIAGYVRSYARYLGMDPGADLPALLRGNRVSRRPWRALCGQRTPSRLAEPSPLRVDPNDVMRRAPKMLAPDAGALPVAAGARRAGLDRGAAGAGHGHRLRRLGDPA
jgi:transcriptional regulator with XRE-family HTH domain